jgi:hypothetical protein
VGVERGLKINPDEPSCLAFLSREDVHNKMVPIEEPLGAEDIENIEQQEFRIDILSSTGRGHRGGLRRLVGNRGGKGSHLCPLRGWGRGEGRVTSRRKHMDDGGKRSRRPVVSMLVKLPRGLRVRLERFTEMAIVLGAAQDASS